MSRRRGPDRRSPQSSVVTSPSARMGIAFVLLVGLSCGLIAIHGEASLAGIGTAIGVGLVAGSGLLWYLHWILA
ncbi:hypothetical protein [Natronococcus amylolyticus]|uniref:hypothetical protein n=1 Tax=Natronococcus amylolyticus TaxID=44470 RepID=UPI0006779937|nr:hypothetical protein [Natronococcus amylolyticus]